MNTCVNCSREITPEMESPEVDVCAECLIYRQDIETQNSQPHYITVTKEMALDAGCPELEGTQWEW